MFSASVKQGARVHKLPRGPGLALGGPACNLVFDTLQGNVCDAMKDYFVINAHGKNTRNDQHLVKLPQVKTEFGRKGFYYLAGKEFNDLPLSARKIESRLLFRRFLENHFICKIIYLWIGLYWTLVTSF